MTSHIIQRCEHCGIEYSFQSSGQGCFRFENDEEYCPTCAKVIKKAICKAKKTLPIHFIEKWIETDEVSGIFLYNLREDRIKEARNKQKQRTIKEPKKQEEQQKQKIENPSDFKKGYNSFSGIDIKAVFNNKNIGGFNDIVYFPERIWLGGFKYDKEKGFTESKTIVAVPYNNKIYRLSFWESNPKEAKVEIKKWVKYER